MSDLLHEKLYTAAEFWEIVHLPENADKRLELVQGEIHEMSLAGGEHGVIVMRIGTRIMIFVDANGLGYVTATETGFILFHNPDTVRGPDVGFIKKETAPDGLPKTHISFPPDLAVEVVSPNERPREVLDKVELYLEAGTQLVWVAYPEQKIVDVWRLNADGSLNKRKITLDGILDGEDVLPGFQLPLSQIF